MSEPIIIGGLIHSGTTYLAEVMENAGVKMCLETFNVGKECMGVRNIIGREFRRHGVHWIIHAEHDMYRNGLIDYTCTTEMVQDLRAYKEACDEEHEGKWGFKHPTIAMFPRAFVTVFPLAKYILCVRNPLRAAQTRVKKNQSPNIAYAAHNYAVRLAHVLEEPITWHFWNYDGDQEEESAKLSTYLGFGVDTTKGWKKT